MLESEPKKKEADDQTGEKAWSWASFNILLVVAEVRRLLFLIVHLIG